MPSATDAASHWRSLAREARTVGDRMTDPAAKRIMLSIAESYERLAATTEARDKKSK
jgi:hypothetical protein